MIDNTERFSNRVDNYVNFRPSYPDELIRFLYTNIGISHDSIIADVGSGTGIFTELILKQKNKVFAVEPNKEMRGAAESLLSKYENFISINGSAEDTTLESASIDFIVSAQAFHWFDKLKARREFARILHPEGKVILAWNKRIKDSTPFSIKYEQLLINYAKEYGKITLENIGDNELKEFFEDSYDTSWFPNNQIFNFEQLKGRLLSSSFAPLPGDNNYEPMIKKLKDIFDESNQNGSVSFEYQTMVFWGKVR